MFDVKWLVPSAVPIRGPTNDRRSLTIEITASGIAVLGELRPLIHP